MKLLIAALAAFAPGVVAAQECTCGTVALDPVEWVHAKWQSSTYVFLGQVTSVAPPLPDTGEVRDQPTVTVLQSYKGDFPGGELRGADCGSSVLPGDNAVFFVDAYNRIRSCSIGVAGITDLQIQNAVLEVSRPGA